MASASAPAPSPFTELAQVEQPAMALFAALGWTTVSALEPAGSDAALGRLSPTEPILHARLRAALARLNPELAAAALDAAADEVTRDRSGMTTVAANRALWQLLRDAAVVVPVADDKGALRSERVRLVDWDKPASKDFLLVSQFTE